MGEFDRMVDALGKRCSVDEAPDKVCARCRRLLPCSEFNKRRHASDNLQAHCRGCQRAYFKVYYAQRPELHVEKQRKRRLRLFAENRPRLTDYLRNHPCVDCGEADALVLDFDHREPANKRMNVAEMLYDYGWHLIAIEISKCDVRCANCHRRKTAHQLGWSTLSS